MLQFTHVVFGVSSSPFLLNPTVNHHMETYHQADSLFVDKFLSLIYVNDISFGANQVDSTYKLYLKSKLQLAKAGFNLRKFVTSSDELCNRISLNEQSLEQSNGSKTVREEDQSYAKDTLWVKCNGTVECIGF